MKKYHSIIGNQKCESSCVCVKTFHCYNFGTYQKEISKRIIQNIGGEGATYRLDQNRTRSFLLREHPFEPFQFIKF
jgi:hypothetical protein